MKIGRLIKTLRVASGQTQKELADSIGMSASALSLVESGEREPSLNFLKAISRHIGVPVSVLLFENDPPPADLSDEQARNYLRVQSLMVDILKATLLPAQVASTDGTANNG